MSFSRTAILLAVWHPVSGGGGSTRALDVADDGTGLVVHELDTALSDTTTGAYISVSLYYPNHASLVPPESTPSGCRRRNRTGSAKDTSDLDELNGGLSGIHYVRLLISTRMGRSVCGLAGRRNEVVAVVRVQMENARGR